MLLHDYTWGIHNPADLPPFNLIWLPCKLLHRGAKLVARSAGGRGAVSPDTDGAFFKQNTADFEEVLGGFVAAGPPLLRPPRRDLPAGRAAAARRENQAARPGPDESRADEVQAEGWQAGGPGPAG